MSEILLYHGSKEEVVYPEIRITRYTKDFSWGFYCTNTVSYTHLDVYKRQTLDYFYGQAGELFSFYRIPKALFQEPRFQSLSTDAKTLYGILLDLSLIHIWKRCGTLHWKKIWSTPGWRCSKVR